MKSIMQVILVSFIIIIILLSLPYILKERDFKSYNDDELRATAFKRGLKPIPDTFEELLDFVDKKDNTITKEKIALGKELFFDTILSEDKDISCSTCHMISKNKNEKKIILNSIKSKKDPNDLKNANNCVLCHLGDESGTDRLATAVGDDGLHNPYHLNTLSILNSSLAKFLTWNGEVKTLEEQVGISIKTPFEMNLEEDEAVKRLSKSEKYINDFKTVFKNENITFENIEKAIAAYVRVLLTRSSFDEFLEGNNNAIDNQAKQGLTNFLNFGCSGCHTGMSVGGQSLQRFPLRNFAGIHDLRPNLSSFPNIKIIDNSFPFENTGNFLGRANTNFFRVPILRNVTKTSPYFHNGSVDKIKKAVEIMGRHQVGINLTKQQIHDIVAFLRTLEGNVVEYTKESKQ